MEHNGDVAPKSDGFTVSFYRRKSYRKFWIYSSVKLFFLLVYSTGLKQLTSWAGILLFGKKFSAVYGTWKFITALYKNPSTDSILS